MIEITAFAKHGGPLTKRLSLDGSTLKSDGSACVMSAGSARRIELHDLAPFAAYISALASNQAISLGRLRDGLTEEVAITTKSKLNGAKVNGTIARTSEYIAYRPNQPALGLIDVDTKGQPPEVAERVKEAGGHWEALVSVLPELATAGHVIRRSTTTGIYRTDTGECLPGSNGLHIYVLMQDGSDVERFLRTLHDRCWLRGFGWLMIGAGGQLLNRSLVDRMVFGAERLVFEGAPVLEEPLAQDMASRQPIVTDGPPLDTIATCPSLTIVELSRLRELRAKETLRLAPDRARARAAFIERQSKKLVERTGMSAENAARVVARQCDGILLPGVVLPFDDPALAAIRVADVLADPARFEGETLSDPLEGVDYGQGCAKIMRRPDGTPWIHSFAHGRTIYELRFDLAAITEAMENVPDDHLVRLFVRLALASDVDPDDEETLRNAVAKRSGINKRTIETQLKAARKERDQRRAEDERIRRAAERLDRRPCINAPRQDAEWLPQMATLNEVLGASTAPEPPMRDIDGVITQVRVRRVPNMHALTPGSTNDGEAPETRLPPPEQPLLSRMTDPQLAELIERHIEYVDQDGWPVHLAAPFVRHFHTRADDILPTAAAIATLPIVLPDGTLLSNRGLDRTRGVVFRVPNQLVRLLPRQEACTPSAVASAMRFLVDDFLGDVATDYPGKCTLIAAALTVIERTLLPDRPTFFVTAGRRGGGKTTTLIMLLYAVTGVRPAAAAWSSNDEERRKALLAYLAEALPAVIWDNITRGAQISCPHIEKACTSAFYSDRKLGVTELISVAASAIHLFTGNNIGPRGDLASRSLQVRLEVDRPDPENREFRHPDPIGWTEANRGRILIALYTVMLGNPALKPGASVPPTRFKMWWRVVGSAVENAAHLHAADHARLFDPIVQDAPEHPPAEISFRDLFLTQEEDDEETANLADALAALAAIQWPHPDHTPKKRGPFQATLLATVLNDQSELRLDDEKQRAATVREFLFPELSGNQTATVTAKAVGKRLKKHHGEPVRLGTTTLCLRMNLDAHSKVTSFHVEVK